MSMNLSIRVTENPSHESHNKILQCCWQSFHVVGPGKLAIALPDGNCTDMGGAIRIAKTLMPDVSVIYTISGGEPDTMYCKEGKDWKAYESLTQ